LTLKSDEQVRLFKKKCKFKLKIKEEIFDNSNFKNINRAINLFKIIYQKEIKEESAEKRAKINFASFRSNSL